MNTTAFPTLNCSKENPQYCYLLGELNQLIQTCMFLLEENKFPEACLLFSHTLNEYIIKLPHTNLDNINYINIFHGRNAPKISNIFKELIEIWKKIQEDQVAYVTGAKTELDSHSFKVRLRKIEKRVGNILSF